MDAEANNQTYLESNATNTTNSHANDEELLYFRVYTYTAPFLLIFCVISIIINIKVLMAVKWLRRPITPTVHLSLSLAAADAVSSFLLAVNLLVNNIIQMETFWYIRQYIDMYRLGSIIVTVQHLLALSVNHWLGVLRPLHYTSIMTPKRVTMTIVCLWIAPITFFNAYFFINDEGLSYPGDENFTDTFTFRITFSILFFISLIAMVFFYTHILIIVIQHQVEWKKLSRSGSKKTKALTRASNQQRRAMEGSIKAIYTTLLILGSCLLGWIPSILKYILICKIGCPYTVLQSRTLISTPLNLFIAHMAYFFLILKTMANPIIYSRRMIEIQDATRRMNSELWSKFCHSNTHDNTVSDTQSQPFAGSSSMRSTARTAVCKLNGMDGRHKSVRRSHSRTLV